MDASHPKLCSKCGERSPVSPDFGRLPVSAVPHFEDTVSRRLKDRYSSAALEEVFSFDGSRGHYDVKERLTFYPYPSGRRPWARSDTGRSDR